MVLEIGEINKYNKAQAYPSVDITFTGPKRSLVDRVSGNAAQFTRNTIGTYVGADGLIKTAAAGEPRYTYDPLTGEELGLLVEENRTNIFLSSTFTSSLWTEQNITKKSSNNPAPDGTNTAVLIGNATSTNTMSRLYYSTNQNGATRSFSFYAKATSAGQSAMIGYYDNGPNQGYAFVNLDNGNITYSAKIGDLVATATPIGSGWWRCQLVVTPAGSAAYYWMAGNAANGDIYIWGAQLETGSYPTSYIPTAGSTITRDPDTVTLTNNNIYDKEKFDIINDPFGVSAGSDTLTLLPSASNSSAIKRATVFSPNIAQSKINTFANKTDEFWRWRVTGDSFGLPTARVNGSGVTLDIDWGDGTIENYTAGVISPSHTYTDGKVYHEIGFKLNGDGSFQPSIYNDATHRNKLIAIGPAPESMKVYGPQAFWGCANLIAFDATVNFGFVGGNFNRAWQSCTSLKSFPLINTSGITNFQNAWQGCTSLTSFPLLDTSSGIDFTYAWGSCNSLTSFPLLDTSNGTIFQSAWTGCNFTFFPEIDTSSGTNFLAAWDGCTSLSSFPEINTSNGTDFRYAWAYCSSLTSFPTLDISNATTFQFAWNRCVGLTDFPANFFDNWTRTPANNCFTTTWNDNFVLTATSVENIYNSISVSAASTTPPASGTNIDVDYSTATGTPDITVSAIDLTAKGWTPTLNGTAQTDPYSFASLDLDFATNLTLNDNISNSNLITFTRGSTGTYVDSNGVIQTAAIDAPRFDHNPDTLESLGLLIEESRTNVVTNSTSPSWNTVAFGTGTIPTVTLVSDAAPDGSTNSAQRFQFDRGTGNTANDYSLVSITTSAASVLHSVSVWMRSNDSNTYTLIFYDAGGQKGEEIIVTPSWKRYVLDASTSYKGSNQLPYSSPNLIFGLRNDPPAIGYFTGINNSQTADILAWGPQIEAGNFPTSYIPTDATPGGIVRAADVASITGTNFSSWFNYPESTLYSEGVFIGDPYNGNFGYLATLDVGINDGSFYFRDQILDSNDTINFQSTLSDTSTTTGSMNVNIGANAKNTPLKYIHAIDVGVNAGAAVNGTANSTTIVSSGIQVPDRLQIGRHGAAYKTTCTISRITYWPKRLTDTSLQYLTQ